MKTIGISIETNKAIIIAVDDRYPAIADITGKFTSLTIKDPYDNHEVREFQTTMHSFFDQICADRIGVIKRQHNGQFSASPLSFKLEGLIQTYAKCEVVFVPQATLTAFYKKNELLELGYKYQTQCLQLANYLLQNGR